MEGYSDRVEALAVSRRDSQIVIASSDQKVLGELITWHGEIGGFLTRPSINANFYPIKVDFSLDGTVKLLCTKTWQVQGEPILGQCGNKRCDALLQAGRLQDSVKSYRYYVMDMNDENVKVDSCLDWSNGKSGVPKAFKQECSALCAANGDVALTGSNYDREIDLYSAAINLNSASDVVLASRTKANMGKMIWMEALLDAQKDIELDPLYYLGYNLKHAALLGTRRHDEAIQTFQTMLSKLDRAPDIQTRKLCQRHLRPSEGERVIRRVVDAQLNNAPLRVFDTTTGLLCDREAQISAFKTSIEYKELLSSTITHPDFVMKRTIMQELKDAPGIDRPAVVTFRPSMSGAREKLRWASTRVTTRQEDIAYSLFGIFGIYLPVHYGEKSVKGLGQLLQEIVGNKGTQSFTEYSIGLTDPQLNVNEVIELRRAALALYPSDHPDRSSALNDLGISLRDRFKQLGLLADLDQAIQFHRTALVLCFPGHSGRFSSLNNLAVSLRVRVEQCGVLADLDEAIEFHRAALALRSPVHSHRSLPLNNLAITLRVRFEQQGVQADLDKAIEFHRDALALRALGHPNRFSSLNSLAVTLRVRFEQRGVQGDLDEAIEHHRAALTLCPPGHSRRPSSLQNFAISLRVRFEWQGALADLLEAIELQGTALALYPPHHSDRSSSLNDLAISLRHRFKEWNVLTDLDEAIEHHRAALLHCPPKHSRRSLFLNSFSISLQFRFEQRGVQADLDEAIELQRAALALYPTAHCDRSSWLNELAISLRDRFKLQGILDDLDEAIELQRAALALYPPAYRDPSWLSDLAISLRDRFKQQGILDDLDEAIELQQAALALSSPIHSDSMFLNNLANSLQDRFQQRGIPSDLEEAIELHRAALELRPMGHSERSSSFNNLANSLRDRFQQWGALPDLEEAIQFHRAALALCPLGHSDQSMLLNNLAISLRARLEQRGILSDLEEAIEHHGAALALRPTGHPDRATSLNNLANSLRDRFEYWGVLADLDEAIKLYRAALALCLPGHSGRSSSLNNLAISIRNRFEERGALSDLDESIELHRAALALFPPDHLDRPMSLNNLANSLQISFKWKGVVSDLDEAIELHRAALALRSTGHPDRPSSLNNLGLSLRDRFKRWGVLSDADEAIELHRAALELCSPDHSDRSGYLNSLAISLRDRFDQQGLSSDLDEAFICYLQLSQVSHGVSRSDLRAAKTWAASAEELQHGSALVAYQTAMKFLDQYLAILSSSPRLFDIVREATSSLAVDAFSYCVRHGALIIAVELVEQGRAVFWTHLARFRIPLDDISASGAAGEALAEEFRQISFRLRKVLDTSPEDQFPQVRQLTMQWDDVVLRIRTVLPGFSRFLLPPLFSDLQKAAENGPVIIVKASKYSCDALIISSQDPVHVPLDIGRTEVSELSSEFQSLAERVGSSDHQLELPKIIGILRKLWLRIVSPIVQALGRLIQPRSRIWWCPTAEFTLLPLHAAGPYKKKSHNLSHFYISSYTPTLSALIRARPRVSRDTSPQHFVAIGQANPDRGKRLRCVTPELGVVADRLAPITSFTSLADSDATIQGAFDALDRNQWLHLACHGTPNPQQPFESSFAMHDGPLMIKDIIRSHWQDPEFAFLSACHTTVGDKSSLDEAIHLAAAIQFSGFRSVIGSMWSVDDEVARQVASAFYDNLVDGSGRLDCTRAAVSLHKAMKTLRNKIPLEQQIVFIHIGA
ncbi:CHAT domain-containing protein [Suillus subluteus]|nr:CHAT domain-containing protein [Suillus subluteus]